MLRAASTLLFLVLGCHQTTQLTPPTAERTHASLFLMIDDGTTQKIWATDLATPELPDLALQQKRLDLYAVYSDCVLEELGFDRGFLTPAIDPSIGRTIPKGTEHQRATIEGDVITWQSAQTIPDTLYDLRFNNAYPLGCASFFVETLILPGTNDERGEMMVLVEPEEALVATNDGKFFRVTYQEVEPLPHLDDAPHRAGYRAPDGEIWLLGYNGKLARGHLDSFEDAGVTTTTTAQGHHFALVGPDTSDAPFELFAIHSTGAVDHFSQGTWRTLVDGSRHIDGQDHGGGVWLGPNEAMTIGAIPSTVLLLKGGDVTELPITSASRRSLTAIADIPGMGVVIASESGHLWIQEETTIWREIDSAVVGFVYAIVPFREGFLVGGFNGFINERDPLRDFCYVEQLIPANVTQMVPFGRNRFLVLAMRAPQQPVTVTFLTGDGDPPCWD